MPSPPKTTDAEIIAAARKLVESRGRNGFSMNDVAEAVGVRAPSLYGRFTDRAALLAAVELKLWHGLARALARTPRSSDPIRVLTAQAHAYRAFAKANPQGYALIHDADAERTQEGTRARAAAVALALPWLVLLVGEHDALTAARVLTPFIHGFVSMELAGAFRLGEGLDDAFAYGVSTILGSLKKRRVRRRSIKR